MDAPIGFIWLCEAVYSIGQKVFGLDWRPVGDLTNKRLFNPDVEKVIERIAKACESGEITATYRSVTGVDSLDRGKWHQLHWPNYFATGTINLDLPLLDDDGRPNANGFTARCTREIFVREEDLNRFVATLSKSNSKPSSKALASKKEIREIVSRYRKTLPPNVNPSLDGLEKFVREDSGLMGHREELRNEYRQQFPNRRAGRPAK
jgi:hypothetical protein